MLAAVAAAREGLRGERAAVTAALGGAEVPMRRALVLGEEASAAEEHAWKLQVRAGAVVCVCVCV